MEAMHETDRFKYPVRVRRPSPWKRDGILHFIHISRHCFERGRRLRHIVLVEVEQKCVRTMVGLADWPINNPDKAIATPLTQSHYNSFIFDSTTLIVVQFGY